MLCVSRVIFEHSPAQLLSQGSQAPSIAHHPALWPAYEQHGPYPPFQKRLSSGPEVQLEGGVGAGVGAGAGSVVLGSPSYTTPSDRHGTIGGGPSSTPGAESKQPRHAALSCGIRGSTSHSRSRSQSARWFYHNTQSQSAQQARAYDHKLGTSRRTRRSTVSTHSRRHRFHGRNSHFPVVRSRCSTPPHAQKATS